MTGSHYWSTKLAPFLHGSKRLGSLDVAAGADGRCSIDLPGAVPADVGPERFVGALALLLFRYTAADDVLIAAEVGGRLLFYRFSNSPEQSVSEFQDRVRAEMEESAARADSSLTGVLAALGAEEDGVVSLFETAFAFGASGAPSLFPVSPALLLSARSSGNCVPLSFSFSRHGAAFASRFARHYKRALVLLAESGECPLRQLGLVSSDEQDELLAFNAATRDYQRSRLLHALVEEQAARTPDAVAVVFRNNVLTYAELNENANRLATYLASSLSVRSGDLVGVIVGRSEMMIVALLAVLKTGAGYVPINPRHPWETVNYMVRNAGIRTLLVNSDTAASAAGFQGELCILDVEFPTLPPSSGFKPTRKIAEKDLAYVIYTSGSTGRPKGVAVEHRAIANTILWRNGYYGMDEFDATLQMPSFAFDSSVVDIFSCLTTGGKLVIPEEDLRLDAQYIKNLIQKQQVTRFIVTPSYYTLLNRELEGTLGIRSVTVAGENIPLELVIDHHKHLPGVRLINEYGPTENAVCSTACELTEGLTGVHIGGPIPNTQAFVLDQDCRLAPIGVPGEIYLAGAGLAREYVNQPALTEERFVAGTIPEFPGRMYRTGDWGRWRSDGTLEFLGRIDNQVKIRGFRIELNEIEHALLKHPGVEIAAVLCKQDQSGKKYLAAYAGSPQRVPASELSNWIRGLLPYYMVPDVIHAMPKLPLNLNGKVDAAALSKLPDFERTTDDAAQASTETQESLLALCAAVFQQGQVGLDDNFFALGANSLLVMEMVSRIRGALKASIELRDVYTHPTVRALSSRIEVSAAAAEV